jgi:crossover junction endodeoxyribonuclease RuvC
MPTLAITRGKTKKREVDAFALRSLLLKHAPRLDRRVIIEQSGPMARDGSMQAWKTGCGWGIVYGVVVGIGIPISIVTVQRWKKAMGATADKDLSRKLAMSAFPEQADHLSRKKDDGRAEAALIALYAERLERAPMPG